MVHLVRRDFVYSKTQALTVIPQIMDVTLSVEPKTMIVTNNHRMGMEMRNQKFLDVFIGTLLRKSHRKGHYYHIVDPKTLEEGNLFVNGIEELQTVVLGVDHLPRVWMKGDDYAFSGYPSCQPVDTRQQLLVSTVDTVKGAYSDNGIAKGRQIVQPIEYSHDDAKVKKGDGKSNAKKNCQR